MKIATWNVNSLKVRLPQLLDWVAGEQPDVVCLQETKMEDAVFPREQIEKAGYQVAFAGQKTYNGVAVLSRQPLADVTVGIPGFEDPQQRVLAVTVGGTRVIDLYVPNGQSVDSDKYQYKLAWLEALAEWLKAELARHPELAVLGDFNIAPDARDVHDPVLWEGQVLFSEPERAHFRTLLGLGLQDAFRLFEQPEASFTWWDYRMAAFRRNMGMRIDHILLSPALARRCSACTIARDVRKLERPSDHAPVVAEIA